MALSVLVVDDNRLMRTMVARTVAMSSLPVGAVHQAGDGQAALSVMRRGRIDLVLLDLNMPVMDGEAFLTAVRADPALAHTQVVVVSTESSSGRVDRLRKLGAGFVHKPFRPEELVKAVGELAGGAV